MRAFGVILALVVAGSVAPAANAYVGRGSADPQHRALHVTKECSVFTALADSFCTITSSNVPAIKAGSRVVYLQAAGAASLDSDVVLVVGPGNYALGHVILDLATGTGEITFAGGAGQFIGFSASADVSPLGGPTGPGTGVPSRFAAPSDIRSRGRHARQQVPKDAGPSCRDSKPSRRTIAEMTGSPRDVREVADVPHPAAFAVAAGLEDVQAHRPVRELATLEQIARADYERRRQLRRVVRGATGRAVRRGG